MVDYLAHWKDFNSPLIRNEIWTNFRTLWPKLFTLPLVQIGIESKRDAIRYFMDMQSMRRAKRVWLHRVLKDPNELTRVIRQADQWGKQLNRFTASIAASNLSGWNARQLIAAYEKFAELQTRQYAIGVLVPLLDIIDDSFFDGFVWRTVENKGLSQAQMSEAYNVLTTPRADSFSRQQERALLKIYARCMKSRIVTRAIRRMNPQEAVETLSRGNPSLAHALARHAHVWGWIYYVYAGPAWNEGDFMAVIQDWFRRRVSMRKLLHEWDSAKKRIRQLQVKYLRSIRPTKQERQLLTLARAVVGAKPRRKDYQSKSYWHMEHFFREIARRLYISLRDARSMTQAMITHSIKTGKIDKNEIRSLYEYHIVAPKRNGGSIILHGASAWRFAKGLHEKRPAVPRNQLHGATACPGNAKGIVRIINTTQDILKMNNGDILVSVATSPAIVAAMRGASAILTDEGGLTCHAAIVSRELNIPCIVGLNVITKMVRDGDRVSVDATHGIVKKI